ncbi:MAG TPA: fatty acid desaturase [Crinalium sp.]
MTTAFTLNTQHDWNTYLHQRKPLWNAIALTYTLGGYIGGIALLIQDNTWVNVLGVVLVTHTLILSAYLAHEFMHGTIFSRMRDNTVFGGVMQWMHGTSYFPFRRLTQYHIDHHIDGVDYFAVDRAAMLRSLPVPVQKIIAALEWLYFPATFFMAQFQAITAPFRQADENHERPRILLVFGLRLLMFIGLGYLSLKALVLYAICYISMVNIVRLMDCLQHSYEAYPAGISVPKKDPLYEQANTFSTPLSRRFPWLNLLLLNFSYHSAHHAVMKCPWYNLPDLDRAIAQQHPTHHISLGQVIANYHRFRIQRLFSLEEGQVTTDEQGKFNYDEFYGVIGGTSILL